MVYIPPLVLSGQSGEDLYTLKVNRFLVVESEISELRFKVDINGVYDSLIDSNNAGCWVVNSTVLTSDDYDILLPKLQAHIKKHHLKLYRSHQMPYDTTQVCYLAQADDMYLHKGG